MYSVYREHAEAGKREHEQTLGHHDVAVYPVTQADPIGGGYRRHDPPQN